MSAAATELRRFRFSLDACATPENAKCGRYFTEVGYFDDTREETQFTPGVDGLTGNWQNQRVWCNPPFSDIMSWVDKAWSSEAELVVMLVPATRTEQGWWQDLVEPYRDGNHHWIGMAYDHDEKLPHGWGTFRVQFLRKRTRFLKDGKPMGSPKFGCCLLIWHRIRRH